MAHYYKVTGGGGGGGAPADAQYLALAIDGDLSAERVFTPGTALAAVDSGANAAYTLNVDVATLEPLLDLDNLGGVLGMADQVTGVLPVANGGTGLSSITDHGLMVGSGVGAVTPLGVGTNNQLLVGATGADPAWATNITLPGTLGVTGLVSLTVKLDVSEGGTGLATLTDHGVLVGSGAADITPLAVGTTGQLLVGATGADPAWATNIDLPGTLDVTGLATFDSNVGIGIAGASADGTLHVHTASAGAVTANAQADDLIVEGAGAGISILTDDAGAATLMFGANTVNDTAKIQLTSIDGTLRIATNASSHLITLSTNTNSLVLTLDAAGDATFENNIIAKGIEHEFGINDDTPADLHVFGGGDGEVGGRVLVYPPNDGDTVVDFYVMGIEDVDDTDFVIGTGGGSGGNRNVITIHQEGDVLIAQHIVDGAIPALRVENLDTDAPIIEFVGTVSGASAGNLSNATTGNSIQGYVRVSIDDGSAADFWMPFYNAPTS